MEFSNTEAGFQTFKAWMEDIAEKYGKTAVIPGMEPTGHYWFALGKFLQNTGMKSVYVNPHHVKKSKELDDNNPNKNDRKDPRLLRLSMRGDSRTLIYQLVSMQRSGACRTCASRRRRSSRGSRTAWPDVRHLGTEEPAG